MSNVDYDSREDTQRHIDRVKQLMTAVLDKLYWQKELHDASKLQYPEKEVLDFFTPKLRGTTYGSKEYKKFLKDMKKMLNHHYLYNSHHPEHFKNRIAGMTLLDLIEMLCDWKAAGERHDDGSMERSLKVNMKRFHISNQLQAILTNTAQLLENMERPIDEGQG